MTDTEMILQAIGDIKEILNQHNGRFDRIDEQLKDIDESIGAIADWADNVSVITKVPFAGGSTNIK